MAARESLAARSDFKKRAKVKLPTFRGNGTLPGVDIDDNAALLIDGSDRVLTDVNVLLHVTSRRSR